MAWLVVLAWLGRGSAQVEAPAGYVESIEAEPAGAGMMGEVDAGAAQAERAAEGEAVPGVSRHQMETVEEIVVQARKRGELLEDTPVSVTAVGQTQLREAGVTSINEVQQLVPNLVFTQSFTAVDSDIKIRGVGTSAIDGIFDPGVGIYLDGVFLSRTGSQMFDIVDIAQIEVLRGPQGTLFGKNTIGGALNVTSVKPHGELEGFAMVRPSNFGTVQTRAMLNVPITDRILSRVAFGSRTTNGYSRNTLIGIPYNDQNILSFLGTLRFLPVDDVTFDVTGSYSDNHGHGPAPRCRVEAQQGLGNLVPGYYQACARSEPFSIQADAQGLQSSKTSGVWGVLNWAAGEVGPLSELAVKAIGSWRRNVIANRIDLDGTAFAVGSLAANGVGGRDQGQPYVLDTEQAELQVNGRTWDDRVVFVTGAFALWEAQDATTVLEVVPDVLGQVTEQRQQFDNWTWALYGQVTADLTDWLSLTGGLRYTEEKKGASTTAVELGDPTMPTTFAQNSAIFSAWTPMGSVAARLPEDLLAETGFLDHAMAYFTYSRGFKGGGFNLAVGAPTDRLDPFSPETLDSFEIGLKTISLEQRLTFNVAVFLGKYDDIQVTTLRVEDTGSNNPMFQRVTLNAGQATTKGVEIEAQALPVQGMQVRGSAGLTDAAYDQFVGPSAFGDQPVNRAGQSFNGVPKWQTHLAVQYSLPVDIGDSPWLTGWLTPRLEWYYQSAIHWDFVELDQANQRGYNLVHARLSYDFLDDRAQVALWGKNLLDEEYFSADLSIVNVAGTLTNYYSPPRQFGAEISYRF